AGREVAARRSEYDDDTTRHVLAAVVARALDDRVGTRVAHGKALAGDAAEVAFAADRAVEHGVADDHALFRHDAGLRVRAHDELAAREALADVVIAFAGEVERDAARDPRTEA